MFMRGVTLVRDVRANSEEGRWAEKQLPNGLEYLLSYRKYEIV
jgi:hypothetical protein